MSFEVFLPDTEFLIQNVRLRDYNITKKLPGISYLGKEETSLADLEFYQNKNLILEVKNSNEEFPEDDSFPLKLVHVPKGTFYSDQPMIDISTSPHITLEEFVNQVSKKFGTDSSKTILVRIIGTTIGEILVGKEKTLKNDFGVAEGSLLYVEECETENCVILQQIEQSQYMIEVSFNLPDEKEFNQDILIDKRKTILELKEKISEVIQIPVSEFKICRNLIKHEFKNEESSLDDAGLFDGSSIFVERGIPLQANQYNIQLFLYDLHNLIDCWSLLGNEIVSGDNLVESIQILFSSKLQIPPEQIRVRDKMGSKAGKALSPKQPLSKVGKLYDGRDLAIQRLNPGEIICPKENEMIVEIQQWKPSLWEFGERVELFVDVDSTVGELKALLTKQHNIPFEHLALAKPRRYHFKDLQQIPLLSWEVEDMNQLKTTPWHLQDGYKKLDIF